MIRKLSGVLAAVVALATLGSAANAQVPQITATAPATIVRSLQSAGYRAELGKDGTGDPLVSSSSSGTSFAIYFYGCTQNVACKTIQFSASYTGGSTSLARINEWNTSKRWGQGYLTDSGTARIQMDVDLEQGGMSNALFVDNLAYWVATMAEFEKFIAAK
jgi:hypothetical protein